MLKLIKVYFQNTLKLSSFTHGPNRVKMWGFLFLAVFVVISMLFISGAYSYMLGSSLLIIDAIEILPAIFMTASGVLIIISVLFTTKGILFGFKDFDIQMSLPVSTGKVVASRIFILYAYEIFYTLVIMLPALGVYAYMAKPEAMFYPVAVITLFFMPVIPIIAGAILGTLVALAASKFKKSSAAKILVLLLFTLALMALSFGMNSMNQETAGIINNLMSVLIRRYPPVMLYTEALGGNTFYFASFVIISALLFTLFSLIVGKIFKKVNTIVTAVYTKGNYKLTEVKRTGAQAALYYKELRCFFSSALYVLNTSFGMVILLIASVAIMIIGADGLASILQIPIPLESIAPLMPVAISLIVCMSSTSCSSISMEGSRFWLIRTLPVHPSRIFIAKMGVNLTITIPVVLVSSLICTIIMKPGMQYILFMFITPLVYCFFISALGLVINLFAPKLDWKNEAQVIKQSSAVLITMLIGLASSGLPLYLMVTTGQPSVLMLTTLTVALITAVMNLYLLKFAGKKLHSLA